MERGPGRSRRAIRASHSATIIGGVRPTGGHQGSVWPGRDRAKTGRGLPPADRVGMGIPGAPAPETSRWGRRRRSGLPNTPNVTTARHRHVTNSTGAVRMRRLRRHRTGRQFQTECLRSARYPRQCLGVERDCLSTNCTTHPTDGSPRVTEDCAKRVYRGGGWAPHCRAGGAAATWLALPQPAAGFPRYGFIPDVRPAFHFRGEFR